MNKISIEKYWQNFCDKHNLNENIPYDAWAFGMTDEQADELANLVNQNIKTATTSAYELYDKNETLPQVGEFSIILNSVGQPVCVIQEKCVEIIPYNLISAEHAYHEGEGDRSYNYWRKVHDNFLKKNTKKQRKSFIRRRQWFVKCLKKLNKVKKEEFILFLFLSNRLYFQIDDLFDQTIVVQIQLEVVI